MPKQPAAHLVGQLRRITWSVVCLLPLCTVPAGVWAQNVPAGLRACTAETDSARRLDCYDSEMARLSQPPAPPAAAPSRPKPDFASGAAAAPATHTPTSTPVAPLPPAAAPQPAATPAPHHSWVGKIFGGGPSEHLTARIAGLDRSPNAMVLHLENGQVWQQIGRASGDLTLQVGDSVTIEKHLGSYWLSASHVSDMQVRLRSQ
ncbi:MAG TPA: hypothetical protein VIC29_02370 [Steroidobacteraceae bacterium]|jgi:hypothetical protein